MTPAWIGLGSNLQDPPAQLRRAFGRLGELPATKLLARSTLYRSAPLGPAGQRDYCNAVAAIETGLAPAELLDALIGIERATGRERGGPRWGPRVLDLDLLVYGDQIIEQAGLRVPHPEIGNRNFVLVPLAELAPGLRIPGQDRPADALAAALGRDGLTPWID